MNQVRYPLFSVTGLEMEYMIVDSQSLDVRPICDELLKMVTGEICSDYENGEIAWSNELVLHVVEIKTNGPAATIDGLNEKFHQNVVRINSLLADHGAVLMPTGAHPWMDPKRETRLWPHEHNEIYSLYNRIFDCRGHGWSNLQSMHINLPFRGDREFLLLHSAIRLIMPLLPALCASTPILDGSPTGFLDSRMEAYRHNQKKIPSIAGRIVPEFVMDEQGYHEQIFSPIMRDIRHYDDEKILDKHFLNSRGAIARFDRGAIEIRVLDLQESPRVDTAVAAFIRAALKWLVEEKTDELIDSRNFTTELLAENFVSAIRDGAQAKLSSVYSQLWGGKPSQARAVEPLRFLFDRVRHQLNKDQGAVIETILEKGCLATRILAKTGSAPTPVRLRKVYEELVETLKNNSIFDN